MIPNLYKAYQLFTFFILKFSYKPINLPRDPKFQNELWLLNPEHASYPVIRITTETIERVVFEEQRIRDFLKLLADRFHFTAGLKLLDVHISHDEILDEEIFDSLAIDSDYYDGIELQEIYPGIRHVIHECANPELEIKDNYSAINNYLRQARHQKKFLKAQLPWVTFTVAFICLIFFLLEFIIAQQIKSIDAGMIEAYIFLGADYKMFTVGLNQWYRLLTAGLLHGSIMHLFVNLVSLFNLGMFMERKMGSLKFATALFLSIIIGSLTSLFFFPNTVSVGISGGLYGLVGVLLADAFRKGTYRDPLFIRLIVLNLLISLMPNIDLYAHLGGFVTGFLLYYIFNANGQKAAVTFAVILTLVSGILFWKVARVERIEPKYGATDAKVVAVYRRFGLNKTADKLAAKLAEVYAER